MFSPADRHTRALALTTLSLAVTGTAAALLAWSTSKIAWSALHELDIAYVLESLLFGVVSGFLVYGNLCYQVARLGRLRRMDVHRALGSHDGTPHFGADAPELTVLVPSYREEISVVRQTLLSAALQEYPNKRVVLLLDDPPSPKSRQDQAALWAARNLPFELRTLLASPNRYVTDAKSTFRSRQSQSVEALRDECVSIAECFGWTAQWLEMQAKLTPIDSHTDAWFVEHILEQPAQVCRGHAAEWLIRRTGVSGGQTDVIIRDLETAYDQLAARFAVEFDVFERKQYCNLSHEPNKAMNLNSFLGLMGKRVKPVLRKTGLYLEESPTSIGSRLIPDTPYVITLDADSLLKPGYTGTLVRLMEQPEHARVAVAQTPYSAFPNPPGILERTAGATTDIQYFVHQGFTRYGATFWVGANALLRKAALEDICTEQRDGPKTVRRYIQDRTVIEDTESTVDLLSKGWSLYNHPERLAYSATPPDFGSLVIQRARWANGGLIIFPKLFALLLRAPQPQTVVQGLLQAHYLTSLALAPLSVLLLLCIPFASDLMTLWMPLAALPYFILYACDLKLMGYRPIRDLIRVYALNLLLIPVHLTGAVTSVRQAVAGTKIPFRRTPKVSGRTRTSGLDVILQLGLVGMTAALGMYYLWQTRWISGLFAVLNAVLLLYGIKLFIGFAELREDLWVSVQETIGTVTIRQVATQWQQWARSALGVLRSSVLQAFRIRYSPRHAALSLLIAVEALSPALVAGGEPPPNSIQLENQRPGTGAWILTKPALQHEIEGYASAPSVNQGDSIRLYVNTSASTYRLTVYRMGWYDGLGAREVLAGSQYQGRRQPMPYHDAESGLIECRWEDPIVLAIPGTWPSGYYLVKLTAEPSEDQSYILFVVREDGRPSTYLVQSSVATFQAYNNWGGKSLYQYNSSGGQASAVSLNRPYAPSLDLTAADAAGAGPFLRGWEYNMVRWLERSGYDVTYTTDLDVHRDAGALRPHHAFLAVGHAEYWSWAMRQNLEEARDRGIHLAFFSANSGYWQIRFEPSRGDGDENRTIVAYKEHALTNDPLMLDRDPDNNHTVTTKWRSAPVNRPEAALIGGMYLEGTPPVDDDLVIEQPDNWIIEGTGLERGARLPGLLGYEVDGLADSSPKNIVVIARSPVGQVFAASTIYSASSGALVFNAGSMQWIWGLDDFRADPFNQPRMHPGLQQMTRHLLDRMSRPEPQLTQGMLLP